MEDPPGSGSDYLSVHLSVHQSVRSGIVDVNTTSDRLIIEQLEHEITQKDRERKKAREGEREREEEKDRAQEKGQKHVVISESREWKKLQNMRGRQKKNESVCVGGLWCGGKRMTWGSW